MPSTTIYSIGLPTVDGDQYTWGQILNDLTFRSIDQYMRDNPAMYVSINASGSSSSGEMRLMNDINIDTNYWSIKHSASGTLDIKNAASSVTNLTVTSGGSLYKYSTSSPYNSHGPLGMFVPLAVPDNIGDWISTLTTTFTDVDVSDDGVPKGAVAVVFRLTINSNGGVGLRLRPKGNTQTFNYITHRANIDNAYTIVVAIDNDCIFQAQWGGATTSVVNNAAVIGYYI